MAEQQYKSPLVQFLWNSVYPQIREAAMAHPIGNMLWKSFEPEIPEYLKQLDENRELQNQIVQHLRGLMAMIEENEEPLELTEASKEEVKERLDKLGIKYSEELPEEPSEELEAPEGKHSRMREGILEDEAKLLAPNHAEGAEEKPIEGPREEAE